MSTEPSGLRATSSFAGPTAPVDEPVDRTTAGPAVDPDRSSPPTRPVPTSGPGDRPDPGRTAVRGKPPPRRKRKARRVHRVVHHLDVWSVAKVTAVFVACGYVTGMISGLLLWQAADRVGTID